MTKFKLPLIVFSVILLALSCNKKMDAEVVKETEITQNNERTLERIEEISMEYLRLAELNTQDRACDCPYSYGDLITQYGLYAMGSSFHSAWINAAVISATGAVESFETLEYPTLYISEVNPYEEYGILHVEVLHELLTEDPGLVFESGVLNNENFIVYARDYLMENCGLTEEELSDITLENLELAITLYDEPVDYSMVTFIGNRRLSEEIGDLEADILEIYYEVMESLTYSDYVTYSVLVEDEIVASEFTESEKELLLMSMALARHDIGYWNHNE